jgi:glycosyltransferase involved in cell wall biosynthesis
MPPPTQTRTLRVTMLDLLSIVPYYTGYLCAPLAKCGVDVRLAAVTYHLDRTWFSRICVATHPGLSDITHFIQLRPAALRKTAKFAECLINLTAQSLRMFFSRPDILHVQFLPLVQRGLPLELWFLRWARLCGVKIVYTVHNVLPHDSDRDLRRLYTRVYQELVDTLIAHDATTQQRLITEFAIPAARIRIIPHGPLFGERSPERSRRERERLGLPQDTCIVACQGILRSYKGVPFLLDAWKLVMAGLSSGNAPQAVLRIAGTGDADIIEDIHRKIAEYGLASSVILDLRFLSVDEVEDCLDSADILAYPYREITTSGALLTGVNYAKAVVATRQPAFDLLLNDEENALLVQYGNVEALAQALLRLIADPALRHQLGARLAKSEFRAVGWTHIAADTHTCYLDTLNSQSQY